MILSKTRSDRRDRRLCRFGVMLVVCSLLINMVAVPKAKAVVIDATAAFGAAAATAAINGTTATTLFTGMSTSAATTAMTTLMGEYATATGAAASGTALASTIGAGTIVTAAGAIVLTAAAGYAVYKFIEWLREDKGLVGGGEALSVSASCVSPLVDGDYLTWNYLDSSSVFHRGDYWSVPSFDVYFESIDTRIRCVDTGSDWFDIYLNNTKLTNVHYSNTIGFYYISSANKAYLAYVGASTDSAPGVIVDITFYVSDLLSSLSFLSFSLQPEPEFQSIPNEIPETDAVVITGIEGLPQNDPQAAADAIFQTAIDGALDPVVTVEADPTVTPDPDPDPDGSTEVEPDPDAPELPSNLGDLGAALTTRFPFSIPWDIARAIKLIAAPAKAPYWEVDFLAPIAYRLPEGWKGSTKIVLDFGQPEYEIIGIASRWTSTIGFCLALAAATKRFIWTA